MRHAEQAGSDEVGSQDRFHGTMGKMKPRPDRLQTKSRADKGEPTHRQDEDGARKQAGMAVQLGQLRAER